VRKAVLITTLMLILVAAVSAFFLMDSDGDGLSNLAEIRLGTGFRNPDTDGDGLSDGVEVNIYRTNPLVLDTDNDGLNDKIELDLYRTNPLAVDTDGDNVSDEAEITVYSTNPLSADTDNDNLSDWSELFVFNTSPLATDTDNDNLGDFLELTIHHTNPLISDTDNDWLSDGLEVNGWSMTVNGSTINVFSDPLVKDSDGDNLSDWAEHSTYRSNPRSTDTDGDGMSDLLEVLYNTDIMEASSVAQIKENAPTYPRLYPEIDYMSGYTPSAEAINYIESYFEYSLGVIVEVVYDEVTLSELAAIGVSTESISTQELNLIESHFHDHPTTHLYVFYANKLSEEEVGGLSADSFGVAVYASYFPGRLDRERTILLHEIGHALGMQHSTDPASAMQSGPTFSTPVYASSWSQRNLLNIWSVDEIWN